MTESNVPPRAGGPSTDIPNPTFRIQGRSDLALRLSEGAVADALRQCLNRIAAVGPDADTRYQEALAGVRAQPASDVGRLIADALRGTPEEAYLDRWSLVQVMADVRAPGLVAAFQDVLAEPIPPERSSGADHRYSTRSREVVIRTTAVEGTARLAAQGSPEAVDCLLANVSHEDRTVRTACVVALTELGGEAAERARERVAGEDRELLDLRRMNVTDVPQPDIGYDVVHPGRNDGPAPRPN